MRSFQKWCEENYSASQVSADVRADRQQLGAVAWRGPIEAKELLELIAKYNDTKAKEIVNKLKVYGSQLKKTVQDAIDQGRGDPKDLELLNSLTSTVRVDMNRFIKTQNPVANQGEQVK